MHSDEGYDVPGVEVRAGDASDMATPKDAVLGQDAVIDTVGGKAPYRHTTLEARVAATVVGAMQQQSVRRLVVRPPFLTEKPATGDVRVFPADSRDQPHSITRADLAALMVAQLTSDDYLQKARHHRQPVTADSQRAKASVARKDRGDAKSRSHRPAPLQPCTGLVGGDGGPDGSRGDRVVRPACSCCTPRM